MIIEPDSLEHLVLHQADDDWLEVGNPNYYAGFFERDLQRRKKLVINVIRSLAEAGYIKIGDLQEMDPDHPGHVGWVEWPGTLDEQLDRLSEVYTPDAPDDDWHWGWASWLDLTDAGSEVVEAMPKPDSRFFARPGGSGAGRQDPTDESSGE